MNKKYAAIIIDIKNSRALNDKERSEAQKNLIQTIDYANSVYKDTIVQKMKFSSGDSVQGLFKNVEEALQCFLLINNLFYPYTVRGGIGYEAVNDYMLDSEYYDSNMQDGKAYHLAFEALVNCKKGDNLIVIFSNKKENDIFINQIMNTIQLLRNLQTQKQIIIFNIFNLLCPLNYHYLPNAENNYVNTVINILEKNIRDYTLNGMIEKDCLDDLIKKEVFCLNIDYMNTELALLNLHFTNTSAFPTKLNGAIAKVLGVKRQHISKTRKIGNFDEIRKLEICVILFAFKNYREN